MNAKNGSKEHHPPLMSASALVDLLRVIEGASIPFWLDGGWDVDALLERQTRLHKDVDITVQISDVPRLREVLSARGFTPIRGSPPHSFVLGNGSGLEVDVHAVVFDQDGNGIYRMENGQDWIYPAQGFIGQGCVAGRPVRCLTAEAQVLCHAHGYVPTEKDRRDMTLLKERFGLLYLRIWNNLKRVEVLTTRAI